MTDDTKKKISATLMGHPVSLETREKISRINRGRPMSSEAKAKISASEKGRTISAEWLARLGAANWKGGREVTQRKHDAKRRTLGFLPMNTWFEGCEGHHINNNDVIYIPKEMHKGVKHDIWSGRNMEQINALACAWLTEDWT